jgi:hypothetical protein
MLLWLSILVVRSHLGINNNITDMMRNKTMLRIKLYNNRWHTTYKDWQIIIIAIIIYRCVYRPTKTIIVIISIMFCLLFIWMKEMRVEYVFLETYFQHSLNTYCLSIDIFLIRIIDIIIRCRKEIYIYNNGNVSWRFNK